MLAIFANIPRRHCFGRAPSGLVQSTLSAHLASWSQRVSVGRQRHSSWARSLSKNRARSTATFTVAFWRTITLQRCRSSQRQLCGKRTTHQATTVRPRGTGRRRTFLTPSLVGLHSLQTWPRWTTASGRPLSPRFQRSVFHRRLLSKQPSPVHLLWSRRPMFLARRSVRSRIAFNSVSMPTEAISRHDFLQMLHSWCESENSIKPNHFHQRSTSAADRQADRQHSCERSNPT